MTSSSADGAAPPSEAASAINGTVIDMDGVPLSGAAVQLGDAVATSDDQGRFHFDSAPATYDIAVAGPEIVLAVIGMRTRAPTLRVGYSTLSGQGATVSVMRPSSMPTGEGLATFIRVVDPGPKLVDIIPTARSDGHGIDYGVRWSGAATASIAIDVFDVQTDPATQAPTHYKGYQHLEMTLQSQSESTPVTPVFEPMPFGERPLTIHPTLADGLTLLGAKVSLQSDTGAPALLGMSHAASPDLAFVVPALPNAQLLVDAEAGDPAGEFVIASAHGLATNAGSIAVGVAEPPHALAPMDGATGVDATTEFSWSRPGQKVSVFTAAPSGALDGSAPQIQVLTADEHVRLPDLSKLGVTWPSGVAYRWRSAGVDAASVDDLAPSKWYAPDATTTVWAVTASRTFTMR